MVHSRYARRGWAALAVLVSACGAAPTKEASSTAERRPAAAENARPDGPTEDWGRLVDERLVWAQPELTNYCIGESVPRLLPAATSADHAHIEAARENGCSALGTSPKGTTVCCPASLPVASNPNTGGGKSCDEALLAYQPSEKDEETKSPSAGQYGAVLNRGSYLAHCKVPTSTKLSICAAIQHGRAVGVTVETLPYQPELAECVAKSVLGLKFPSRPRLDVTKTTF
ncbi:MAG: hypothetical protein IPM35_22780 [Myxococcales bacterium]|nr:hypothetical protein [Myxococcales bacterium]